MLTKTDTEKVNLMKQIQILTVKNEPEFLAPLKKQQTHQHCIMCSTAPLLGLKLNFYCDQTHQVWACFQSSIHQQGYQGILHGGVISALLDSSMCQALFKQDIEAVTADMNIRFLNEVKVNSQILIRGSIVSSRPPLHKVEAEIYVEGQLMAKSTARFMDKNFCKNND